MNSKRSKTDSATGLTEQFADARDIYTSLLTDASASGGRRQLFCDVLDQGMGKNDSNILTSDYSQKPWV